MTKTVAALLPKGWHGFPWAFHWLFMNDTVESEKERRTDRPTDRPSFPDTPVGKRAKELEHFGRTAAADRMSPSLLLLLLSYLPFFFSQFNRTGRRSGGWRRPKPGALCQKIRTLQVGMESRAHSQCFVKSSWNIRLTNGLLHGVAPWVQGRKMWQNQMNEWHPCCILAWKKGGKVSRIRAFYVLGGMQE